MNTLTLSYARILPALATALFSFAAPHALAESPIIISGGITLDFDLGDGLVHSLNFQVVQQADGTVRGEVHNSSRQGNEISFIAHVRIDCIHFLDENTVILTGVDVWDTDPEYVGTTAGFIVRDNGEGKFASVDLSNGVYYGLDLGFPLTCESVVELIETGAYDFESDLWPALTGNIKIQN